MSTPALPYDPGVAMTRARELSDPMIELARDYGVAWLAAYEKVFDQMIEAQRRVTATTLTEGINALTAANAEFMRQLSAVYFRTLRQQLR